MNRRVTKTGKIGLTGAKTESAASQWTFLTNHTHVLVVLHHNSEARIRDMAAEIGITERAVQRILAELVSEGILNVRKDGRRNVYSIKRSKLLRHPLERHVSIGDLLDAIG